MWVEFVAVEKHAKLSVDEAMYLERDVDDTEINRAILDGPLMISEIISWSMGENKKMLLFKVDFEKAYDSVNWDYLLFMLSSLGFSATWCDWIKGCLDGAKTSILVNRSLTREFDIKRGLR
ncbi:uncharacterized protein [Rutidosis leptorrhynchoides]|uniref:uncharacterized protein n=1 Tax=Rutidosis leptorrhynchoides TaxID=125765 RepID=UPI003A99622A